MAENKVDNKENLSSQSSQLKEEGLQKFEVESVSETKKRM